MTSARYEAHLAEGNFTTIRGCSCCEGPERVIWGCGAMMVRHPVAPCDDCGRVPGGGREGEHVYWDLVIRCTPCARIWIGLDEAPDQGSLL